MFARNDLSPLLHRLWLGLICLSVLLLVLAGSVRTTDSDPWGALLVSQALLEHGTVSIEAYPEAAALTYRLLPRDGRIYYVYPIGTSLAALPAVWLANRFGLDMAIPAHDYLVQELLAALTIVGVCLLCHRLASRFVGRRAALLLALTFTLGTSVASTMGTALWSFNLAILWTLGALLLVVRSADTGPTPPSAALIGLFLVAAYVTRPTALAAAAAITLYLLLNRRWPAVLALGCAAALALLGFGIFSLLQYGLLVPPYYQGRPDEGFGFDLARLPASLYGLFFSPGRGLLSFTPFLLLTGAALLSWPHLWRQRLVWLALIWFSIHTAAMLSWRHWWGGASFGPRLFTDALPTLFLLTVLVWQAATLRGPIFRRIAGGLFGLFAVLSIAIHTGQGLYAPISQRYHFVGFHTIEVLPAALFDWRYPQFLLTPELWDERDQAYRQHPPLPNTLGGRPIFGVQYLRTDPDWRPSHMILADDLALRFNGALMVYEERWDVRLIFDRGEFWIVSDADQAATLRFQMVPIGQPLPFLITHNDAAPIVIDPSISQHVTLYLRLREGANRIYMEFLGCRPRALSDNGDVRLVGGVRDLRVISHSR